MRKLILIAALAAAVAAPTFSLAATACERARSENRTVGTIAGGVLGALAGSAIASRHDSTAGVLVGGAAGAYAGNQLAKGRPCPAGYARVEVPARPIASHCFWRNETYRDRYGALVRRQVRICR